MEKVESTYVFFGFSAGAEVSPVKSKVAAADAGFAAPFLDPGACFEVGGVFERRERGRGLEDMRQITSGI